MVTPQRIAVIGCSGAGKSTLARAVAEVSGLPLIHLDAEHWRPGWVEPDHAEWTARSAAFAQAPRWIIDGQYGASLTARLARAELVIWLDLPTRTCLAGVLARWWRWRGRVRPDMGPGCPEKMDAEFLHFVATFRRRERPRLADAVAASGARAVRLTSPAARARFTAGLRAGGLAGAMAWRG